MNLIDSKKVPEVPERIVMVIVHSHARCHRGMHRRCHRVAQTSRHESLQSSCRRFDDDLRGFGFKKAVKRCRALFLPIEW